MNKSNILKGLIYQFLGLLLYGFGIASIVVAGIGASPIDALSYYLDKIDNINFINQGIWLAIINLVIALILFIITKEKKLVYGVVVAVVAGVFVNLGLTIYDLIFNLNNTLLIDKYNLLTSIIVSFFGIILLALGIALMIVKKSLLSSYDDLSLFLEKLFKKYFIAKVVLDGLFLVLALIFGFIYKKPFEQIGILSIVIVIGLGPIINLFIKLLEKEVDIDNEVKQVYWSH